MCPVTYCELRTPGCASAIPQKEENNNCDENIDGTNCPKGKTCSESTIGTLYVKYDAININGNDIIP